MLDKIKDKCKELEIEFIDFYKERRNILDEGYTGSHFLKIKDPKNKICELEKYFYWNIPAIYKIYIEVIKED